MEALRLTRRIGREEAAREIGAAPGSPRYLSGHLETVLGNPAILGLPTIPVSPPIITDPTNSNVGKFKFILGISRLGGPDVTA